jgi:transposase
MSNQSTSPLLPTDVDSLARLAVDLQRSNTDLRHSNETLTERLEEAERQIAWFRKQIFGRKSEKRQVDPNPHQLHLGESLGQAPETPAPAETVAAYVRRKQCNHDRAADDTGLRFDDSVPVETIELPVPELTGPAAADYEVIGEKVTYRLAQHPASYVVLKYVRKVVKHKDTAAISSLPAPAAVFEKSYADVSLIATVLLEKFLYHQPLYRQHQRLTRAGIKLSRMTLTNVVHRAAQLLIPIVDAQLRSVLQSHVLAMDETPIKAGRAGHGRMRQAYYWPIFGDRDEIVFTFSTSRGAQHVKDQLGAFAGTLLSDGYSAYGQFAKATPGVTFAQCWVHARRHFVNAETSDPVAVAAALDLIGALYEAEGAGAELIGAEKLEHRIAHCKPAVDAFFAWCHTQVQRWDLTPKHPLSGALQYALKRQHELKVFLSDPAVPLDTNHLERALRVIPMGRRNWLCVSRRRNHAAEVMQAA